MERHYPVAAVTLIFGLVVFGMAATVARLHATTGILAPMTTGDPRLERAFRAHLNTVEWTPIFLPAMWLFAIYWSVPWAAALGSVWLVGRVVYLYFRSRQAISRIFHTIIRGLRPAARCARTHRLSCLVARSSCVARGRKAAHSHDR
jgi:glutathione S-transferase